LFHSNEPKRARQASQENCNEPVLSVYDKNIKEIQSDIQGLIAVTNAITGSFVAQAQRALVETYEKTKENIGRDEALLLIPVVGTVAYGAKKAYDFVVETKDQAEDDLRAQELTEE
jgi:hypothetical protein